MILRPELPALTTISMVAHFSQDDDVTILTTHFTYPDGEAIKLYVCPVADGLEIHDNAHTTRYLKDQMVDMDAFEDVINDITAETFCDLDDTERLICHPVTKQYRHMDEMRFGIGMALCNLIQCIVQVCALHTNTEIESLEEGE